MSDHGVDAQLFYENLGSDYDRMTRFPQRLPGEREIVSQWRQKLGFESVVDAACGTGLHAIALAQLGVRVVASDLSETMLTLARHHAKEMNVDVTWVQAPMESMRERLDGTFDMILCLGNSLPHLLDEKALLSTLKGFHALLNPGGHILLQMVNYDRVLAQRQRIVAINRQEHTEFIRFYDFDPPFVDFNILRIDWSDDKPGHCLNATRLYPYRREEVQRGLVAAGFSEWQVFGDMKAAPFSAANSANMVLLAKY